MFADDAAFIALSYGGMQGVITHFAGLARAFGLQVDMRGTEMVFWQSPGTDGQHWHMRILGGDLATVREFKCLGSTATYNNKLDTELQL